MEYKTSKAQREAQKRYMQKHKEYYSNKANENTKKVRRERIMYKERNEKAIEITKNFLKTEDRGYYQIIFKEILKILEGE